MDTHVTAGALVPLGSISPMEHGSSDELECSAGGDYTGTLTVACYAGNLTTDGYCYGEFVANI